MSLDSLYPYAGDHAIQNAVFALDFHTVLSPAHLKELQRSAIKAYGAEFPVVQEQQMMALDMSAMHGAQQLKGVPQPAGFSMQRHPNFPQAPGRSIQVTPNNLMVVVQDYTRWKAVKADVDRYLDALLSILGKNALPIIGIGLQYTDVFHWKADPSELVISEVFSSDTPFLVGNVFAASAPRFWHCHHGYFVDHASPVSFRQLDNINVSRIEATGSDSLQVLTSHRAQLAQPLWKVNKENKHIISEIFESLHSTNKVILHRLLSGELQTKIKLDV